MVHKITIEDGKDDLANQVAENPVEDIVKSAPAQVQSQVVTQSVEMTEEEKLFGKPEDEDKIFGTKEEAQRLFGTSDKKKLLGGDE